MPVRARPAGPAVAAPAGIQDVSAQKIPREARLAALTPEEQYARALHRHLAGLPRREIDFFINARRVEMMERLIGPALRAAGAEVLNVACGPFAVEFYLNLAACNVVSFDREPRLEPLHRELTGRGLISSTSFEVADASTFATEQHYDVVLINDLFYSRHVDFHALLPSYAARVKPGGILYFDIQDQRAGPLWRAFRKDGAFRRYDLADVARRVRDAGFEIEAIEPALGIKGGVDGLLRRSMWRLGGLANSYVFVARKTHAAQRS